ncbi:MAG: hypothetical protein PVSMB7_17350 [Chloroflexota bacterium]
MLDATRLDARRARIDKVLNSASPGEVDLLRAARSLRRIHADLEHTAYQKMTTAGHRPQFIMAGEALVAMEHSLKRVLLNYPFVNKHDLRDNVKQAALLAAKVLDLLEEDATLAHA